MKLVMKRFGLLAIAFAVMIAFTPMFSDGVANAKSKIKLNDKTVYLAKGATYTLKIKGVKAKKIKKIKWKSSNKKVVKVTRKGKLKAKLTGKKIGKATITAKVKLKNKKKYKKLKCKVIVEKKSVNNARYLRSYILDPKKSKSKAVSGNANERVIEKEFPMDNGEETLTVSISANKKSNAMTFRYKDDCETPYAYEDSTMIVNLINGKSGTIDTCYYYDDYSMDYDDCKITITPAAYTKAGAGLAFKDTDINCQRMAGIVTNTDIEEAKAHAKGVAERSFGCWNAFFKAKKIKNDKVQLTMTNIGFRRY